MIQVTKHTANRNTITANSENYANRRREGITRQAPKGENGALGKVMTMPPMRCKIGKSSKTLKETTTESQSSANYSEFSKKKKPKSKKCKHYYSSSDYTSSSSDCITIKVFNNSLIGCISG